MKIDIREAKSDDASEIAKLLDQLGYPFSITEATLRMKLYTQPTYQLLIAKKEDVIVGFIALHIYNELQLSGPVGRITSFCVNENNRGTGIGTLLLNEAEDYFKANGCFKIEVTSNLRRTITHQYYLHQGFKETSKHFVKIIDP